MANDLQIISNIEAVPMILDVVCKITGMGFATIARVTERQWLACAILDRISFGLKPGNELPIETTFCRKVRSERHLVVIDKVAADPDYCTHPIPALYGFQSYISVPIILKNGEFFGTLCAIDPAPASLKRDEIVNMFTLFADILAAHIWAQYNLVSMESALLEERATAELRDQFIAVLGHDLRDPLNSIGMGVEVLKRSSQLDNNASRIVQSMQASVQRMTGLIDNILDFARGRLGDGIVLHKECKALELTLMQVVDETRTAWPLQKIETSFDLSAPFYGDHARLAQLFANLLNNAIIHGERDMLISVKASLDDADLVLKVINKCKSIDPSILSRLFMPFQRGNSKKHARGLGLGLFIAAEIAKAHGGTLDASFDLDQICITIRVPHAKALAEPATDQAWRAAG